MNFSSSNSALNHMALRIVFIEVLGIFTFGGGVVGNEEHGDKERLPLLP